MAETTFSGQSDTILRMRQTVEKKDIYPAYEYLRLSVANVGGDSAFSFHFGGWGRLDLAERSTDRAYDGDLQYGYLSYRDGKNNLVFNVGRQFVSEGVAAERLDGFYLRSDLAAGFGASAYFGAAVVTEPSNKGAESVYGGRITQSMPKYYSLGVSVLRADLDGYNALREEIGTDIWIHPLKQMDLLGRSSYNTLTSGWMEHAYAASYPVLENLTVNADVSSVNYRDYFYHTTTNVFSFRNGLQGVIDKDESLLALGVGVAYRPIKNLSLAADYKNYGYDKAGNANYFGGKATYSVPESYSAGLSIHRMDGESARLRYDEYRVFASKKLGKLDLTVDFFDVNYDRSINGINNTYSITGAAAYEITEQFKVAADIDYSKNPDFDNEVRGFVKLTYAFDSRHAEGRAKSEK